MAAGNPFRNHNPFPEARDELPEPHSNPFHEARDELPEPHQLELYLSSSKDFSESSHMYRNPHVCLNNKGLVVVFYGKYKSLYYRVGKCNRDVVVTWGDECFYHDGFFPQAVLGDNNVIVVVRSHVIRRRCSCRVGKVIKESLTIKWGKEFNTLGNGTGINPSVALIEQPKLEDCTVIIFYETSEFFKYRSFYSVGRFNDTATRLLSLGQTEKRVPELDHCRNISVSANKEGTLLLMFQSSIGHTLSYAIGKYEGSVIHNLMPISFTIGYFPKVSLLNDGMAIEIHEAALGSSLVIKYGNIEDDGKIQWSKGQKYESAYKPSLACTDDHKLVEVHTSFLTALKYRTGHFM